MQSSLKIGQAADALCAVPQSSRSSDYQNLIDDCHVKGRTYLEREVFFHEQERLGNVHFHFLCNSNISQHSIWLIALKNIYSKQLPNMPREYITRLVFDKNHSSVAVVKKDGTVVGGITYRKFFSQGFGEIAFCAISACNQVKGFGSRLMSYAKDYAKKIDGLSYFLTYADNNAVQFFSKQGFTSIITMSQSQWSGYIKDYDGGTLMECILHNELPYTKLMDIMRIQYSTVARNIQFKYPDAYLKRAGLPDSHWICSSMDPTMIPGYNLPGIKIPDKPSFLLNGQVLSPTTDNIYKFGIAIMEHLLAHPDAGAFLDPVSVKEVPDYYDTIKDPMDLRQIVSRLKKKSFYVTFAILQADIHLIFTNARLYNASDTYWFKAANRLEKAYTKFISSKLIYA